MPTRSSRSDEELREYAAGLPWFHSIELRPGVVTPGFGNTRDRLDHLRLPERLDGKTVLDVGAWDGFFSFEAERRGAQRVVAADSFAWNGLNWSTKDGFLLAREELGSSVEDVDVDIMDLSAEALGTYDVVLLLGVLYHMRHPLLALERVAEVTAGQLILETHVDLTWMRRPAMAFYPGEELNQDPTNWWGPNPAAVAALLKAAGFRRVEMVTPDSPLYRTARAAKRAIRRLGDLRRHQPSPDSSIWQGRGVFHAFR